VAAGQEQAEAYYKSLTRKIVFLVVVASAVPLVLISATIRYYFQASYQDKVREHLQVLVKKYRQNIDTFLNDKMADIGQLAMSFPFEQLNDSGFLSERLSTLRAMYGRSFVDLGVVDARGVQTAYAGPFKLEHADYSQAQWFKDAMEHHEYVSDVFPGLRGIPHFIVTIRQQHQGAYWILRATVDFEAFNSLVENIRIGSTGFAFILNKKGEFQTKPRSESVASREPFLSFLATRQEVKDEVEVTERPDESGSDYIYVMSPLKNGDWLLGYQQSAADAYSAVYAARRFAIIIFVVGVLGMAAVAVLLSNRIVKHIARADREKEMMQEKVIEAGKLVSVGELAAGIAHEINNPVAVMVEEAGWIQDLLEEEDLKACQNLDEFKRALNQIRTQGNRCKQITHKLLSFARKTDPRPAEVQVNDLIEEVIALCQQRARYGNVKIVANLAKDLPTATISPTEVQQVLINMVNNGLDAIDEKGGEVVISTKFVDDGIVIDVADNGPGIPEAILPRIFDPFFTTKPVGKGTGLGLSICYGIISKIGGSITVNSATGIGTTFHIQIPVGAPAGAVSVTKDERHSSTERR
jgi:two-component system, NtrC family, sensor kinase